MWLRFANSPITICPLKTKVYTISKILAACIETAFELDLSFCQRPHYKGFVLSNFEHIESIDLDYVTSLEDSFV